MSQSSLAAEIELTLVFSALQNLHHDAGRQGQRSKNTGLPQGAAGGECHHH